MNYLKKYLKYKEKYLNLKITQSGQRYKASLNLDGGSAFTPGGGSARAFMDSQSSTNLFQAPPLSGINIKDYIFSLYSDPGYSGIKTEDKYLLSQFRFINDQYCDVFGIFDGHGDNGSVTSRIKKFLHSNLINMKSYINTFIGQHQGITVDALSTYIVEDFIPILFREINEDIANIQFSGGSTCSLIFIFYWFNQRILITANIGDSPIYVFRKYSDTRRIIFSSINHDANNEVERKRIIDQAKKEYIALSSKNDFEIQQILFKIIQKKDRSFKYRLRSAHHIKLLLESKEIGLKASGIEPTSGFGDLSYAPLIGTTPDINIIKLESEDIVEIGSDSIVETYKDGTITGDPTIREPEIISFLNKIDLYSNKNEKEKIEIDLARHLYDDQFKMMAIKTRLLNADTNMEIIQQLKQTADNFTLITIKIK